jgi:hypothetical protein
MLVPEPMRPGWPSALRMSVSALPHERLVAIDARMREAAARPVIVPDQVVIDHGKVFVSDTFVRACDRLGISVQPARKDTPTDKGVVEATFTAIKTLFAQHVAGFKGANPTMRGRGIEAAWTIGELQDLFDEWVIVGWQHRGHDALRDPHAPRRKLSPNEKYAALVAAAGYLPLTLTGSDYLELLPVKWRQINDYGVRIDNRIYDCAELGRYRRQPSGLAGKRGLWEVHYDPYDLAQVFVRNHHDGGLDHRCMDASADGGRPVRRLHLAARAPPGRRVRPRRHRNRDRPRVGQPTDPRRTRPGHHRAAAGPTQPRAGLRPPRPDPVWSVRHREDDGADSARPHPRARDPQAPPRPGRA